MLKAIRNNVMYIDLKSRIPVNEIKVNYSTLDKLHTIYGLIQCYDNGIKKMCNLKILIDNSLRDYEFKLTVSDICEII